MAEDSTYEDHVRRSEIDYLTEFERWESGLSDQDRGILKDAAAPDLDFQSRSPTGREGDAAESSVASEWPDIASLLDSDGDRLAEKFGLDPAQGQMLTQEIDARIAVMRSSVEARILARVASVFCECPNPKLAAVALAFASGLSGTYLLGKSMREWARKNGVSVAAVSKIATRWADELGLENTQFLRPPEVRESYRDAQLQRHWRNRR